MNWLICDYYKQSYYSGLIIVVETTSVAALVFFYSEGGIIVDPRPISSPWVSVKVSDQHIEYEL